jgi:hypothetical protein
LPIVADWHKVAKNDAIDFIGEAGAARGNRTHDLIITNDVLFIL